jgi:hypothetical protein
VVIPGFQQLVMMRPQMADYSVQLMRAEPEVDRYTQIMKPEFGFLAARPNVNVRGLPALIRVEKRSIGTPAQNSRHIRNLTAASWLALVPTGATLPVT